MSQREYDVRLLPIVEEDLTDIIAYIAAENPSAAQRLLIKIEKNLANLSTFPFSGTEPQDKSLALMGYRYLVVEKYLIFYTVGKNSVLVHRIIHGARDYKKLL